MSTTSRRQSLSVVESLFEEAVAKQKAKSETEAAEAIAGVKAQAREELTKRRQAEEHLKKQAEELTAVKEKLQQEIAAEKKKAYDVNRDKGNPEKPENVKDSIGTASVISMIISMLTTALILMFK